MRQQIVDIKTKIKVESSKKVDLEGEKMNKTAAHKKKETEVTEKERHYNTKEAERDKLHDIIDEKSKNISELSDKHAESTKKKNDLKHEGDALERNLVPLETEFLNAQKELNHAKCEKSNVEQQLRNLDYSVEIKNPNFHTEDTYNQKRHQNQNQNHH